MGALGFHVQLMGAGLWALAALHVVFPRAFHWERELARLSLLNRRMFQVHCGFICLMLGLMGSLCLFYSEVWLADGRLGRVLAWGIAVFWSARLMVQWVVYDWELWWGRPFETSVHVIFTVVWIYFTAVPLGVALR